MGSSGFNADIMDDNSKDATKKDDDDDDEITKLLLQHEKKNLDSAKAASGLGQGKESDSDSSDDMEEIGGNTNASTQDKVEAMSSDDDDDGIPTVRVGNEEIPLTDVNEGIINRMTSEEKDIYTQKFQDFYAF